MIIGSVRIANVQPIPLCPLLVDRTQLRDLAHTTDRDNDHGSLVTVRSCHALGSTLRTNDLALVVYSQVMIKHAHAWSERCADGIERSAGQSVALVRSKITRLTGPTVRAHCWRTPTPVAAVHAVGDRDTRTPTPTPIRPANTVPPG